MKELITLNSLKVQTEYGKIPNILSLTSPDLPLRLSKHIQSWFGIFLQIQLVKSLDYLK